MKAYQTMVLCHVWCFSVLWAEDIAQTPGPPWVRSFDEAQQKARDERKDLPLVFTGHGWCHSCERLDREVFRKPEFIQEADPSNLMIRLDAAESHLALGEGEAAQRMIREVEAALPVNPQRELEKQRAKQIRARIADILDRLAKQAK